MKHEYADPARHVEFSCDGCKHLEGPFGIKFCVLKPGTTSASAAISSTANPRSRPNEDGRHRSDLSSDART